MFLKTKMVNGERRHVVMEAYRKRKGGRVHLRTIHDLGPTGGRWTRVIRRRLWEAALAQSDALKDAMVRWERDAPDLMTEGRLIDQYRRDGIETPSVESRWEEIIDRRYKAKLEALREQREEYQRRRDQRERDWSREADEIRERLRRYSRGSAGDSGCLVVLGLTYPASEQQIKAAYRRKAVEIHPDRGGTNEAMIELNQAYQEALTMIGKGRTAARAG